MTVINRRAWTTCSRKAAGWALVAVDGARMLAEGGDRPCSEQAPGKRWRSRVTLLALEKPSLRLVWRLSTTSPLLWSGLLVYSHPCHLRPPLELVLSMNTCWLFLQTSPALALRLPAGQASNFGQVPTNTSESPLRLISSRKPPSRLRPADRVQSFGTLRHRLSYSLPMTDQL